MSTCQLVESLSTTLRALYKHFVIFFHLIFHLCSQQVRIFYVQLTKLITLICMYNVLCNLK